MGNQHYSSSTSSSKIPVYDPHHIVSNLPALPSVSPGTLKRKRRNSRDSLSPEDYGWFEDFESPQFEIRSLNDTESDLEVDRPPPLQKALTLPIPVSEPPFYILEASLETQRLWYTTAGRRPQQPQKERDYFEKLWKENFDRSKVQYSSNNSPSPSQSTSGKRTKLNDFTGEVLYRGRAPFSNAVSKTFGETPYTIYLPYYRIVCDQNREDMHAEFLIVVTLGGNRRLTFGIWRRHSEFAKFADQIITLDNNIFQNSNLSWQCVMRRKRWYKSLERDYLALKCFLLQRFLHDVLFESPTPTLLNQFLGLNF